MQTNYDIVMAEGDIDYGLDEATVGYTITGVRSVIYYSAVAIPAFPVSQNTVVKRRLKPMEIHDLDDTTIPIGPPDRYVIEGDELLLDSEPSATEDGFLLRLRVFREPAVLTGTNKTVIPSIWDEVILLGARWRAERDLGYRDLAEETKQNYAALINEYDTIPQIEASEEIGWTSPVEHNGVMTR
jgi:hypothetical protein